MTDLPAWSASSAAAAFCFWSSAVRSFTSSSRAISGRAVSRLSFLAGTTSSALSTCQPLGVFTGPEIWPGSSASAALAKSSSTWPAVMTPRSPPLDFVFSSSDSSAATLAKSSPFFSRSTAASIFFFAAASSLPSTRART